MQKRDPIYIWCNAPGNYEFTELRPGKVTLNFITKDGYVLLGTNLTREQAGKKMKEHMNLQALQEYLEGRTKVRPEF